MNSETVDAVTDWESRPFSGGYEGLRELAEREFSGAVTQGTAWAFMINGRLVGIEDGSLSAFEAADGTAYEAPHRGLPLLYAMQGSGEKQAEYYTNKKPISEADTTLSSGGFTGYIELSENVLSGDYYTVYYGGKSMSVAFVGNSRQLLTDEEAFERADDEVGIYTVYAADLDVIDIPEPAGGAGDESTAADDEPTATDDQRTTATDEPTETDGDQSAADDPAETTAEGDASGGVGGVTPTPETSTAGASSTADGSTASSGSVTPDGSAPGSSDGSTGSAASGGSTAGNGAVSQSKPDSSTNSGAEPTSAAGSSAASSSASGSAADGSESDVFSNEAEWRNAKTIPSLDPSSDSDSQARQSGSTRSASTAGGSQSRSSTGGSASQLSRKQLRKRLKRAEQVMDKAEQQHEQLVEERDAAIAERDEAREELESVRQQLSEAEAEVERLRERIESGSATSTSSTSGHSGGRSMSTSEALDGTNLLVRYASKGDATLEDAISGAADREAVRTNLRIEPHTTFDSEGASVDGTPFETFLEGRIELAFVRWLVEEFLFDIQETGNQTALKGIYETIPAINRAELRGTVSLGTDDEGDELEASFDLVVRNKRDEPLFVADFNESKQPVGGGMVNSLVRDGSEIIQDNESFAGAFAVTTSYYEGAALDAAADATGGGLLSASRGKSFVYISRKQGFHLCLVEKLGDDFDLHVPEL